MVKGPAVAEADDTAVAVGVARRERDRDQRDHATAAGGRAPRRRGTDVARAKPPRKRRPPALHSQWTMPRICTRLEHDPGAGDPERQSQHRPGEMQRHGAPPAPHRFERRAPADREAQQQTGVEEEAARRS
jgi:hypothetical protein